MYFFAAKLQIDAWQVVSYDFRIFCEWDRELCHTTVASTEENGNLILNSWLALVRPYAGTEMRL